MSLQSPQLEAFMAVAHCKTVHGAAKKLYITQTGVTQRIRALEQRLKTTLFVRTRRGMLLTAEGETLLHYCQSVQHLGEETLKKIMGISRHTETTISICGPSSIMHARVIPECLPVMQKFPQLLFHFDIIDIEERDKVLRNGVCQFALLQKEQLSLEMEYKVLQAEKYVLVAPMQWQKRKLADIIRQEKIIDFNPTDQMTFNYLKYFDLFAPSNSARHFVNHPESMAYLIASGAGYGVLTKEFAQEYLKQKKLVLLNGGKIYENRMVLAWYPRPQAVPYFLAVIENIK